MIELHSKKFELFITETEIDDAITSIANKLNNEIVTSVPLFLVILNGSFIFASDLLKKIKFDCEIEFLKVSTYSGTKSNNKLLELIGLNKDIKNRDIIVLEDIIDTGFTMSKILEQLLLMSPSSIKVVSLLYKPDAIQTEIDIFAHGFAIKNNFVVGYGLDFDGLGRNLPSIYINQDSE